jgi:hypothetical protein
MPNVPTFINKQNIALPPQVNMPAPSAAAMGAGLYQGAMNAAGEIGAAWAQVKQRRDDLAASSAYTEYAGMVGQYLHGQTGADGTALPGALSAQGRGAQNITAGFAERIKNLDGNFAKKLTPEQYQLWKQRADILTQNTVERLTVHEVDQMRKGDIEQASANAQAMLRESVSGNNWSNGDTFENVYMVPMRKNLEIALTESGMHPAMVREKVAEAERGAVENRVQAAIGAGSWESARMMLSDKRLNAEQRGMLAHKIEDGMERAKRAAEVQAAKELKAAEDTTKEQLAYAILHTDYTDGEAVDGVLESVKQAPFPELALQAHDQIQMRRSRVVAEQQKSAEQIKAEMADGAYRQLYRSMSTGLHVDSNGVIVHYSPAERVAMIDQAFALPDGLKLSDRNALLEAVKKDSDKRVQDVTAAVFSKVVPEAKPYFATTEGGAAFRLDDNGRLVLGQKNDKAQFDPATKLFRRMYDPGRKVWHDAASKMVDESAPVAEAVTLADIQDSLRVVKERMDVDPKMTADDGVVLFRELAGRSLDKLAKNKIQVSLREQSGLTEAIRQKFERARMSSPAVQR